MMSLRTTARAVGGLFITATVAGLVGVAFETPIVGADDYLTEAAQNEAALATGALLTLIMGIAVVAIAVVIHPVLKRYSERLALGYIAARTIEGAIYVVSTIGLLTLLTLGRSYVDAGAADPAFETMGALLLAVRDWGGHAILDVAVFTVSAFILNYVLYRARLVPRWLSGWGLVGAALYLAAGVAVLYGLEPLSTPQIVLEAPLGLQEMALAIWLIVKGFDTSALTLEPANERVVAGV